MEKTTTKRLANLNGKMLKKAVSVTKTLTAGDDKATVELVGQMGGLVNEMTAVVNRYGNGTSLPQPVNCEGMPVKAEPIPTAVIAEKLDAETPSELDLHKVVRADGKVTAYFEPTEKIVLGYDPGNFASLVVGQFKTKENTLRVMKEIFTYPPRSHADMAAEFNAFFGCTRNRVIDLYYDRAGNKKNAKLANQTDAQELKAEIEKYGWRVSLKNLGQGDIYYWQHHRLWKRLLAESEKSVPRIRIDSNECPNLISAMYCCKKIPGSSPVELDKSPEKKVRIDMQAGLTPQIPSALTYLVWGLFQKFMPGLRSTNFGGGGLMGL